MESQTRSWVVDPTANNPFARPRGIIGRIAGRIMLRTNKQDDVVALLAIRRSLGVKAVPLAL